MPQAREGERVRSRGGTPGGRTPSGDTDILHPVGPVPEGRRLDPVRRRSGHPRDAAACQVPTLSSRRELPDWASVTRGKRRTLRATGCCARAVDWGGGIGGGQARLPRSQMDQGQWDLVDPVDAGQAGLPAHRETPRLRGWGHHGRQRPPEDWRLHSPHPTRGGRQPRSPYFQHVRKGMPVKISVASSGSAGESAPRRGTKACSRGW